MDLAKYCSLVFFAARNVEILLSKKTVCLQLSLLSKYSVSLITRNFSSDCLSSKPLSRSRSIQSLFRRRRSNFVYCSAHSQTSSSKMSAEAVNVKELQLPFYGNILNNAEETNHNDNGLKAALEQVVKTSSHRLLDGGILGVPTDTIYGIAGLAQNEDAVNRIYDIKQRNYAKPVAISVGTIDDIYRWSKVTVPRQLLCDLLPGAVTVVFERSPQLNPSLNPGTSLVGIRIPDHIFMRNLAIECNSPIALTSANVSGDRSCLQVEEFEHLWPLLDLVVNSGKLNDSEESRLGSTVVDLSVEGTYRIIRPGSAHTTTCAILRGRYNLQESSQGKSLT